MFKLYEKEAIIMGGAMRRLIYLLITMFCLGLFVGAGQFILQYQTYTNVSEFPKLSVSDMRVHMRWLVKERPFGEVKAFLLTAYPNEEPISHGVGHLLGEEAYRKYGNDAFAMCDRMLNYGCYHGVVDMAIRIVGAKPSIVGELKRACDEKMTRSAPCIHPIGHASAIVANYDIQKAFALCDEQYLEANIATDCWDGAMMEYINRSAPNAPSEEYGSITDPFYPCNTVGSKYLASCVSMHVSYLNARWSEDFVRIIRFCHSYSDTNVVSRCITSMGSIIGQKYFTDPSNMIEVCRQAGSNMSDCIGGAIVPLLAAHKDGDANIVCRGLTQAAQYDTCLLRIKAEQNQ